MKKQLIFILFITLFWQCEEAIDLKLKNDPKPYLVVDGFITTQAKEHKIRLTRASPFNNNELTPFVKEIGASVQITDDTGNGFFLLENEPGVYSTLPDFAGKAGSSYQLKIQISETEVYESTPQKIEENGILDSIIFEYEENAIFNTLVNDFSLQRGLRFFADYQFPEQNNYMAFDWEGTFILKTEVGVEKDCYVFDANSGIFPVVNNEDFDTRSFENQSIFFFNYDFKFRYKYSLNVLMYSFGEEAHAFLSGVQQQLSNSGSIFDPAPSQIQGNIINTNDASEVILGFFGAYNVTEKRIFIENNDIPAAEPFNICDRIQGPGSPPLYCFDCLEFPGSDDRRPAFWE